MPVIVGIAIVIIAYAFMENFIVVLQKIKAGEPLQHYGFWTCILFALMMGLIGVAIIWGQL